jgi:hypothetical protein
MKTERYLSMQQSSLATNKSQRCSNLLWNVILCFILPDHQHLDHESLPEPFWILEIMHKQSQKIYLANIWHMEPHYICTYVSHRHVMNHIIPDSFIQVGHLL